MAAKRILVVEDDRKIAAALRRGLEADGFRVDVSLDGDDGVWHATERHYDLIVLDLLLPGMNGFRICRILRERSIWTPVLVLTAKDGELDETEALDTGADDYLTKPFSFPVLKAHVRALLRRETAPVLDVLEVGGLRLDRARHRCWRDGVEISLTARELSLLELLVERAGRVLSKSDILDTVWDYDFDGDPNIVEVYVARLRRKIDRPFATPLIHTVRGAGYRFDDGA